MKIKTALCDILNDRSNHISKRIIQPIIIVLAFVNIGSLIIYSYDPTRFVNHMMYALTYYSGSIFMLEYIIRLWTADIDIYGHKRRFGRIKYVFSFYGIIDIISVLPFILPFFLTRNHELVEVINFTRVFLVLKILRYSRAFDLLREVMISSRQELLMVLSIGGTIVTFSALLMYYIERDAQPDVFVNVGSGFWWAIITFATVGYGDIYPITDFGRLLGGFIAIVGVGMIAMPTAIISSALMSKIQERKTKRIAELAATKAVDEIIEAENSEKPIRRHCPHCGLPLPIEE